MKSDAKDRDEISRMITLRSHTGELTCAEAHRIAEETNAAPEIVGKRVDDLKLKLTHCQLGLFGHSPDKKQVSAAVDIPENLKSAIIAASEDSRISCEAVWDIARRMRISRQSASNACEGMKIRIKPCQLGAFKHATY